MKKYNQNNFTRYKQDVKASQPKQKPWQEYTRDELAIKFLPLVENIARKFKDSDAANGVISLSDRIQFGHIGLIKAIDKIVWKQILTSKDPERTIKSYLAKDIELINSIDDRINFLSNKGYSFKEITNVLSKNNLIIFLNSMLYSPNG